MSFVLRVARVFLRLDSVAAIEFTRAAPFPRGTSRFNSYEGGHDNERTIS
jgi:hypothetical protein